MIANEGYNSSPASACRSRSGQRGAGIRLADICPSKPEGMKYILGGVCPVVRLVGRSSIRITSDLALRSGRLRLRRVPAVGQQWILKAAEPVAALARQKLPGVKIILSTWYFDQSEFQGLAKKFAQQRPWADYILAEGSCPTIGGLPVVGFPEISMWGMYPWGGYGATVLPQRFPDAVERGEGPQQRRFSLFRGHFRGHPESAVQPVLLERSAGGGDAAGIRRLRVFAGRGG